ncbi:MAG: hypothetical protein FWG99_00785 [Treponema sp.]|nr:hypothetical protein [Treponema sp.]
MKKIIFAVLAVSVIASFCMLASCDDGSGNGGGDSRLDKYFIVANKIYGDYFDAPIELTQDEETGIFSWEGDIEGFESYLKIFVGKDSPEAWTSPGNWIVPSGNARVRCFLLDTPETSDIQTTHLNNADSWSITYDGTYLLVLDLENNKMTFTKTDGEDIVIDTNLKIAIVGESPAAKRFALPPDPDATMMTQEADGLFTYQGILKAHAKEGLSFATNKSDGIFGWGSSGGIWFAGAEPGLYVADKAGPQVISLQEVIGQAPMIAVNKEAEYLIVLDPDAMEATFTRIDE